MLFLKFPKHLIKSKKTEEIRFTECVSETSKTLFILWFHAELIKRGSQNISETVSILFQISSKAVAKCDPEISETLFIKVNCSRFLSKTVK